MSTKIEEVLAVMQEVRKQFFASTDKSIKSLRIAADKRVANNLGLKHNTSVSDAYRRRLKPDIKCTKDFDRLLEEWLRERSNELEVVLRKHSETADKRAIDDAFEHLSETEEYLANEFDYNPHDPKFKEGKFKLGWHLKKERNKSLVDLAKITWSQDFAGTVRCVVCNFSFLECYGMIGEGYIEAHHKRPVSDLTEETEVKVEDLAPVCSNCHSMIHHRRPWCTIEELQHKVKKHT